MAGLRIIGNTKGLATFIALMIMLMLTLIGLAALKLADDEINIAGNEMNEMTSFYAAEAGLERAAAEIQTEYESTGKPPTHLVAGKEEIGDKAVVAYVTREQSVASQRTLTNGTLAGLRASVKSYEVESIGTSLIDGSQIRLTQEFQTALVPIFQFAVFYDNDLEIAVGADKEPIGRVHTNGNLWLQADSALYMFSYATSSGDILHGRKGPGSVAYGDIYIKDTRGNYQNMKNGDGSFLQSTDPDWYDLASARWGGRVQDATFGMKELELPLNNAGDPHKIIERGAGNPDSYEHLADLKIIDGLVYVRVGSVWQNVSGLLPAGTLSNVNFHDAREGIKVKAVEIDMSKFKTSAYYPAAGVIYFSDRRGASLNAVRLKNGADIDTALSIFSENPMYVLGDFNSINKKPVALVADAITFLSNNWEDSLSSHSKDDRVASATVCNACIITGNISTTSTDYSGGLENLPRFLEDWTGTKFIWRGSMVNLWNSQEVTGKWNNSYYSPPYREWAYDTDLDDYLPPKTPRLRIFQRTGWKQEHVVYSTEIKDSSLLY